VANEGCDVGCDKGTSETKAEVIGYFKKVTEGRDIKGSCPIGHPVGNGGINLKCATLVKELGKVEEGLDISKGEARRDVNLDGSIADVGFIKFLDEFKVGGDGIGDIEVGGIVKHESDCGGGGHY
jgi:hypothetical protein